MAEPVVLDQPANKPKSAPRATAESMATKQRDISVSEFFAKNRHLLGFDNPRKALLTTVKEAVDNSLDACEEAGILPDVIVAIEDLQPDRPASAKSSRYRITIVDNGPGIVRKQVEHIFGRLLYGSKFHRLKMSRGQQGIGISAAGMYGLLTTGKPMVIHTRPSARKPAHHIELAMNTKTNRAEVTVDQETDDFPPDRLRTLCPGAREAIFMPVPDFPTGTCVSIELDGKYQRGRGSVDEFLELTAIANPHARFTFVRPSRETVEEDEAPLLTGRGAAAPASAPTSREGAPQPGSPAQDAPAQPSAPILPEVTTEYSGVVVFPRGVADLPSETQEIQPHPKGIELGILLQMLKEAEQERANYSLYALLQDKFCRVSSSTASSLCDKIGVTSRTKAGDIDSSTAEKLFQELQEAKLPPPPTDCLAPIGVQQLLKGMFKGVRAEFYAASSREPAVYRGRPFLIEAAIAFGGELAADDSARVIRFANRVPLLFQQSACSSFKAVAETNWRNYDLQQPRGGVPVGPLVIMIHMASVWVPFTSESKEAIADYDEIRKEMKLALMECGRKLGAYLRKRLKLRRESERRDVFERYIGEISQAVALINGVEARQIYDSLLAQARKRTAIADIQLNEDGKAVKDEDPADQDGVIIVPVAADAAPTPSKAPSTPTAGSPASLPKPRTLAGTPRAEAPQPSLLGDLDAQQPTKVRRTGERGAPSKNPGKTEKGKPPTPPTPRTPPTPAPTAPTPSSKGGKGNQPKAKADAPKPKMRLVNGKLVPVRNDDGPGLF